MSCSTIAFRLSKKVKSIGLNNIYSHCRKAIRPTNLPHIRHCSSAADRVTSAKVHFNAQASSATEISKKYYPKSRFLRVGNSSVAINNKSKYLWNQANIDDYFRKDIRTFRKVNMISMIRSAGERNSNIEIHNHLSTIAAYLEISAESFTSNNLCNIIYGLGNIKQSRSSSSSLQVDTFEPLGKLLSVLSKKLSQSTEVCSKIDISMALFGLKCIESDNGEVRKLIIELAAKLNACHNVFDAQAVSNSIYGLQSMKSDNDEVRILLKSLSRKIESCNEPLKAQHVSNAIYGLQNMSSDNEEIRQLLEVLTSKVFSCNEPLNAQGVGNSLYGLKGMSSDIEVVRKLITVLIPKVEACSERLKAQELSNCLMGLRNMSCDHEEVRRLLQVLLPKLESSTDELTAQAFSNCLYGLQSLSTDHEDVCSIVKALLPKLGSSSEPLTAQGVGNSLYGLKNMNCDSNDVVLELLDVLTAKVTSCSERLRCQDIGSALYGLQNMSSDNREVRMLLKSLTPKIVNCVGTFDVQSISNSLYGLMNMSSVHKEVRQLINALLPKISSFNNTIDAAKGESTIANAFDLQAADNTLYGLQSMSSQHTEVRLLIKMLTPMIESCIESFDAQAVGNAIFGLQGMSSEHEEVCQLVKVLTSKVASCADALKSRNVGNALYGLQSMSSDSIEVRHLLTVLSPRVETAKRLDVCDIDNALYGLQNMSSNCEQVRGLIQAITSKIEKVDCSLNPMKAKAIGYALYGLQSMSSTGENDEVRQLLATLAMKIESCTERFEMQTVSDSLYGLQGMNSEDEEVCLLLAALTPKIQHCFTNEVPTSQQLGDAFYGLQSMNSDQMEVKKLLRVLKAKLVDPFLQSDDAVLSVQTVESCFYGLRLMNSINTDDDGNIVKDILVALANKVETSYSTVNSEHFFFDMLAVSNLLHALHLHSELPENLLITIEKAMADILASTQATMNQQSSKSVAVTTFNNADTRSIGIPDVLSLYQSLVLNCPIDVNTPASSSISTSSTLMKQFSKTGNETVQQLKSKLSGIIENNSAKTARPHSNSVHPLDALAASHTDTTASNAITVATATACDSTLSVLEEKYASLYEADLRQKYAVEFQNNTARIERNTLLHGFECNMVLHLNNNTVNYEIEGSSHLAPLQKIFNQRRDSYLQRVYNVTVIRYDISKKRKHKHIIYE